MLILNSFPQGVISSAVVLPADKRARTVSKSENRRISFSLLIRPVDRLAKFPEAMTPSYIQVSIYQLFMGFERKRQKYSSALSVPSVLSPNRPTEKRDEHFFVDT